MRLIDGKDADSVNHVLQEITAEYGDIIKTVTADNGIDFSSLENVLADVYYAHPYQSCDRTTNEAQNRMIRRDVPKGKFLDELAPADIGLRNILIICLSVFWTYKTPEEVFHSELKRVRR